MDDLTAFVTARLDEDEANASGALALWADTHFTINPASLVIVGYHRSRHPARALREVSAKRAILALHAVELSKQEWLAGPEEIAAGQRPIYWKDEHACVLCGWCEQSACLTVRHLALAWSDHPDYDPKWTP